MIANDPVAPTATGLGFGLCSLFVAAAREHCAAFRIVPSSAGLEIQCAEGPGGATARSFLKVCSVRPDHTVVFFYKRSLLPFSRDRFSYGGCEWPDAQLGPAHAQASLDYLGAGLSPGARPSWLRRSLPFSIPE